MSAFPISSVRCLGILGALLLTVALVLAVPAFACSPDAQITTRPARGEAGALVNVDGSLFDPGVVRIWFDGPSGQLLATLRAAPDKTFHQQVRIPAGAQPGHHSILATVQSEVNGRYYSAPSSFVVEGVAAPQPPPAQAAPPSGSSRAAPSQTGAPRATPQSGLAAPGAPQGSFSPAGGQAVGAAPGQQAVPGEVTTEPGAAAALGEPGAQRPLPAADLLPPQSESGLVQPTTSAEAPRSQRTVDVGPSSWLLFPLGLIGGTLFLLSGASFAHEVRERRQKVKVEA